MMRKAAHPSDFGCAAFCKKKGSASFAEPLLLFIVTAESVGEDEFHLSRF